VSAELDEATGRWIVRTRQGDRFVARAVFGALGPLHRWSVPKIPGIESFRGKLFHSARWDHGFDPRGKRVATVGAGASAIQFIPELVKDVARLCSFQRTPAWVLPREEGPYRELTKQLFEKAPALSWVHRARIFAGHELRTLGFAYDPRVLRLAERLARRNLERSVQDPKLREILTPSYRMGCKRILMSNTYYPALAQPHVEVIGGALERVTETGVVGPDGRERPVDAIILGTGFDVHDYLGPMKVTGRCGEDLGDKWGREGAHAYLGVTVPGYPNLFLLVGPNTGLGSNSILFMIEAQVELAMRILGLVRDRPGALAEVRPEVERAFNEKLQAKLRRTIWETGCKAWYHDGQGRNSTIWPGLCSEYWLATRRFEPKDYVVG
jgi:cation diffusion facilitator CzcD-associated flavoprotein CzcO